MASPSLAQGQRRLTLGMVLAWIWRAAKKIFRFAIRSIAAIVLVVVVFFSIGNFVLSTPRIGAYRVLHPRTAVCEKELRDGLTILAQGDPVDMRRAEQTDDDGWIDPSNDEAKAADSDKDVATALRCAWQKHIVPSSSGDPAKALVYHLGFIEFKENGEPYPLIDLDAQGVESVPTQKLTLPDPTAPGRRLMISQLDVAKSYLSKGSNYVIVFIHGWRHDASIGDGNVADLRHYAAHAVRFLRERCETEHRYCDTTVTALYIGWRGARVNEGGLKRYLGKSIGGTIGSFASFATLFDRKPVSEQVAPGAISALRSLSALLSQTNIDGSPKPNSPVNRMIIFGHSLGGNMLATGLEDDLIKQVERHKPGAQTPPVLGNLVVLINPASEAIKWTSIQREVWRRIAFQYDGATTKKEVIDGHAFFPPDQRPVVVSVTSALTFPPGGLRQADCEWRDLQLPGGKHQREREELDRKIARGIDARVDYDWATQDLFPTFKFDFRPLAALLVGRQAQSCDPPKRAGWWSRLLSLPRQWLGTALVNFPFQNRDQELSHTIGHLDPPRPAGGAPTDYLTSAQPFGTTHELYGIERSEPEKHHPYATLADTPLDCKAANHWLTRARRDKGVAPAGTFWNSASLAPSLPGAVGENPPAAQFLHGFHLGGTAAITRANDPYWNMRAFDNALARHDGYRLSSFICAMNQLVMDEITEAPSALPSAIQPVPAESLPLAPP